MVASRFLSSEQMSMLLDFTISTENKWVIILATCDEELLSRVQNSFSDDEKVKIEWVRFGCDALVLCSRKSPDLLIIDEEIPDISCEEVIRCVKRMEELKDIRVLCCLKSKGNVIYPDWGANDYFTKYFPDKVYFLRKVNALLYTAEPGITDRGLYHERRWPRTTLNITAKIEMFNVSDSSQVDKGEAVVENISRSGACISQIKLGKGIIPDETFMVRVIIDQPPLKNWKADSAFTRLKCDESAGVKFINISTHDQLKIDGLFEK